MKIPAFGFPQRNPFCNQPQAKHNYLKHRTAVLSLTRDAMRYLLFPAEVLEQCSQRVCLPSG
jgi:hypothetical protein